MPLYNLAVLLLADKINEELTSKGLVFYYRTGENLQKKQKHSGLQYTCNTLPTSHLGIFLGMAWSS